MKRSNAVFSLLFLLGIFLLFMIFLVFVPEDARSNVAWLNFSVFLVLYIGLFGRYTILFRPLADFADSVPLISSYWISFGLYASLTVGGMICGWRIGLDFEKQLLIQIVLLFLFFLGLAAGYWVSERHSRASVEEKQTMSQIRLLQQTVKELQVMLEAASDDFRGCRRLCEALADDLNSMPGADSPRAVEVEKQIHAGLVELGSLDLSGISPDDLAARLHALGRLAALRKTLR